MPTKRGKKPVKPRARSKPHARSVKRVTAAKPASRPKNDALQDNLSSFMHWWKQGFQQIVFEIDQLARVKRMPLIDARLQSSPRVDVSTAHRNAIDALTHLDRAGIANLEQEVRHELLWPVTGSFGGRIRSQEELDRTVSRLRQFPDNPENWQEQIVNRMLEIRGLGESYFEFLAARLRKSKRARNRPSRRFRR
jgi:hypothetical protein